MKNPTAQVKNIASCITSVYMIMQTVMEIRMGSNFKDTLKCLKSMELESGLLDGKKWVTMSSVLMDVSPHNLMVLYRSGTSCFVHVVSVRMF